MRGASVLLAGVAAMSACSTVLPREAPQDAPTAVLACANGVEGNCASSDGRPERRVAFPDIKDWSSLRISLVRTGCYSACPDYTVTIASDGTVSWHGEDSVKTKGNATGRIAPEKVQTLFEAFREAEFFWLFDKYMAETVHHPMQVTTISFDGHTKTVTDFEGDLVGMPEVVRELECSIDEVANTPQWIGPPPEAERGMPYYPSCAVFLPTGRPHPVLSPTAASEF